MTATNWPLLHKIGLWELGSAGILLWFVFAWVVISGGSSFLGADIYIFPFPCLLRYMRWSSLLFIIGLM